jgi:hypothetical protein
LQTPECMSYVPPILSRAGPVSGYKIPTIEVAYL